VSTNIIFPVAPFLDQTTGRPSLPWLLWLQNPSVISLSLSNALGITSGGTGLSTLPTNGQLLIGNNGAYNLGTLTAGSGIGVTNGAGSITVANTGVLSNIAGSGISVSSATGNVTIGNTGVLSFQTSLNGLTPTTATSGAVTLAGTVGAISGGTGLSTYTTGDILYASATNTLSKLTAGTNGYSLSIASGVPTWKPPYTRTSFTATAGQTTFTVTYYVGYVQVFLNGVLLNGAHYTASNGTSVVLAVAANLNDIVETIAYNV
jgi:hypothetical protein